MVLFFKKCLQSGKKSALYAGFYYLFINYKNTIL